MADVFISYSRRDLPFVRRLTTGLQQKGLDVWVDLNDIMPSAPWMDEISVAITEANAVVFVITPDSVSSPVCAEELRLAVERHKRLVPVVAVPTPIAQVPGSLAALNFLDFSAPGTGQPSEEEAFQANLTRLVEALQTDIEAVHLHTRLLVIASEWEDNGNDPGRLLRGKHLADAERWLAAQGQRNPAPTPSQVRLVLASRRAAVRRQRGSMAVALAVALGMVGLSVFAVVQWRAAVVQRAQAQSRAYAAEATDQLTDDPPKALDLALKGFQTSRTTDAATALRRAVKASTLRAVLPPMPKAEWEASHTGDGTTGNGQISTDPSGQWVAIANYSGGVEVWRWRDKSGPGSYLDPYRLAVKGAEQAVFARGGRSLLIAAADGSVLRWAWTARHKAATVLSNLQNPVLSPDGALVASFPTSLTARSIVIADVSTGEQLGRIAAVLPTLGATFSPDGSLLASWGATGPVFVWDVNNGHLLTKVGSAPEVNVHSGNVPVAISPDGTRVAISGPGPNQLSVYPLSQGGQQPKVLNLTAPPGIFSNAGAEYVAGSLAWSPNGQVLAEGGYDQSVRLWIGNFSGVTYLGPVDSGAGGVAFTPDGQYLVSGDAVGETDVWEWGADIFRTLDFTDNIAAESISPDGDVVAYVLRKQVGKGYSATVWLWRWQQFSFYPLISFPTTADAAITLTYSPNDQWLALTTPTQVTVFDIHNNRQVAASPVQPAGALVGTLSFAPSGKALAYYALAAAAGKDSGLVSWRWANGAPPAVFRKLDFSHLAISHVASNGAVDFIEGRNYLSWAGHSSASPVVLRKAAVPLASDLFGAAFIHGGTQMVAGIGSGNEIDMVDLATGASRPVLAGYYTSSPFFSASPDGNEVGFVAADGTLVVWDGDPADSPATTPTYSQDVTATLSDSDVLLNYGSSSLSSDVIAVMPAEYALPLPRVVAVAKSLLVRPTAVAEAASYAQG